MDIVEFVANSPFVVAIIGAVVLVLIVIYTIIKRYRVAGPNEAFIITGRKQGRTTAPETGEARADISGQKVVMGGGTFVWPFVQQCFVLELSSRRISVSIRGAVSAQGIKVDLDGVAIVKVGGEESAVRAAAQRFLDQQDGIDIFTQEVLAGSLRAIVGRLTVEEIIKDRARFASAVAEEAESSLANQGLWLDTFQLQDIQAEGSYLEDLGRPEAARVRQDAAIAEARANQASEQERYVAEEAIAIAARALELKNAEIQAETDAARARAAAAGPLAQAAQDQEVLSERYKVAEKEAALKERVLDTEIRKPADADRYRVEQEAEARKTAEILDAAAGKARQIADAEAHAEQDKMLGDAERHRRAALAEAVRLEGAADADAERSRGEADGAAILARGQAEAEALDKKADAFAKYNDAAKLELLVKMLPELVRAASDPISNIDELTVISTEGASSLARSSASNVEQMMALAKSTLGIDIGELLGRITTDKDDNSPKGAGKDGTALKAGPTT